MRYSNTDFSRSFEIDLGKFNSNSTFWDLISAENGDNGDLSHIRIYHEEDHVTLINQF